MAALMFLLILLLLFIIGKISDAQKLIPTQNNLESKATKTEHQSMIIDNDHANFCNQSDTCVEVERVPLAYRDLRTRNCMCDDQCIVYGDCCKDSKLQTSSSSSTNNNFSCIPTATNGYIYMKTSCPPSSNQSNEIQESCETTNHVLNALDVWIFTPVTVPQTGFVYKNMFCAFCNGEKNFDFWKIGFTCVPKDNPMAKMQNILKSDDILSNLQPRETLGLWESIIENITYQCSLHGKLQEIPKNLRYCAPKETIVCTSSTNSSIKCSNYSSYQHTENETFGSSACHRPAPIIADSPYTVSILNSGITKIHDRCHQIPEDTTVHSTICKEPEEHKESKKPPSCFNKNCLIHAVFRLNIDVILLDNSTIFWKERRLSYPISEWMILNGTSIYICGRYIPETPFETFMSNLEDWVSEILIKFSIICLLLHLLIFQQLPDMRNLSSKSLAVFCTTLLVAFVCYEIGPRLPSCEITAIILHYSLLSCFTWTLIMSYDCWRCLSLATKQLRSVSGGHKTRFLIYCAISWIIPSIIVGIAIYFELSPREVIPCNKKLGYGQHKPCFISQVYGLVTFFIAPASCMFFCNICFFLHTSCMIYCSQRSSVNPNARNDFLMYSRLALMMGLTWTLGTVVYLTEIMLIELLFSIMNMSQGVLMFFAFNFKQQTLKQLVEVNQKNPRIAHILSVFIRETVPEASTQMTHVESSRE